VEVKVVSSALERNKKVRALSC